MLIANYITSPISLLQSYNTTGIDSASLGGAINIDVTGGSMENGDLFEGWSWYGLVHIDIGYISANSFGNVTVDDTERLYSNAGDININILGDCVSGGYFDVEFWNIGFIESYTYGDNSRGGNIYINVTDYNSTFYQYGRISSDSLGNNFNGDHSYGGSITLVQFSPSYNATTDPNLGWFFTGTIEVEAGELGDFYRNVSCTYVSAFARRYPTSEFNGTIAIYSDNYRVWNIWVEIDENLYYLEDGPIEYVLVFSDGEDNYDGTVTFHDNADQGQGNNDNGNNGYHGQGNNGNGNGNYGTGDCGNHGNGNNGNHGEGNNGQHGEGNNGHHGEGNNGNGGGNV